jgi:hypothetical protein
VESFGPTNLPTIFDPIEVLIKEWVCYALQKLSLSLYCF